MTFCPIALNSAQNPKSIAIEGKDFKLSYGALDHLVSKPTDSAPFIASKNLATIVRIFALWRAKKVACLLSHHLPPLFLEKIKKQMLGAKDLATLLLTSGTTADPKIAAHSLDNHLASASAMIPILSLEPGDRYLLNLPLFHVAGLAICVRTFLAGATLVLEESEQITHLSAVPTQLFRWRKEKKIFPHLKTLLLGGGAHHYSSSRARSCLLWHD